MKNNKMKKKEKRPSSHIQKKLCLSFLSISSPYALSKKKKRKEDNSCSSIEPNAQKQANCPNIPEACIP